MLDVQIKTEIQQINERIYSKYSEEEVKEAVDTLYCNDGDIKHQRAEFHEEYQKSLMGVPPEREMTITRKINKEQVLKCVEEILQGLILLTQTRPTA